MVYKYGLELDKNRHPVLVQEASFEYDRAGFKNPGKIVDMINNLFHLKNKAEEYVYMCSFDANMNLLGLFEVSHGGVNQAPLSPREVALRALITGAVGVVIIHNHPSLSSMPSYVDKKTFKTLHNGLRMIGMELFDYIIIGDTFFSFREEGIYDEVASL